MSKLIEEMYIPALASIYTDLNHLGQEEWSAADVKDEWADVDFGSHFQEHAENEWVIKQMQEHGFEDKYLEILGEIYNKIEYMQRDDWNVSLIREEFPKEEYITHYAEHMNHPLLKGAVTEIMSEDLEQSLIIENIEASTPGSDITVQAYGKWIEQADTITFSLKQGEQILSETMDMQPEGLDQYNIAFTFEKTDLFSAGQAEAKVSVEVESENKQETKTFGLYQTEGDYSWQWADTDQEPFNMIGKVVSYFEQSMELNVGTGFLISPRHILTSAHVLSGKQWSGNLQEVEAVDFYLGQEGQPLVKDMDAGNYFQGEKAYLQNTEWESWWPDKDMAIVRLDREPENLQEQDNFEWFWNGAYGERDLVGEEASWAGYPMQNVEQGYNASGEDIYFQWTSEGRIEDYIAGDPFYGRESGGLRLEQEMSAAKGVSGAPIFFEDEAEKHQFAGVYAGSKGEDPVAANLDPVAYNWALGVVQGDGYLQGMEFVG